MAQHEILKALTDEENLLRSFRQDNLQQTEPIISTNDGIIVNGNRRLCIWRELYYADSKNYKPFETIKIVILPDCDERAIRDLDKRLGKLVDLWYVFSSPIILYNLKNYA